MTVRILRIKSVLTILLVTALLLTGSWSPASAVTNTATASAVPAKAAATPQVLIGSGTAPRAGAMLDLNSTTQGVVLPNIALDTDLTQFVLPDTDKASSQGMMIYNTNTAVTGGKGVYVWMGTAWKKITVQPSSVSVDPNVIEYTTKGAQDALTATVLPVQVKDKSVTWSSSEPSVATVHATTGVVTVLTNGTTTITAMSNADNAITGTCAVTVRIGVSGLVVNPESMNCTTLGVQAQTLTAEISPYEAIDKNVTWLSRNTAIATVSQAGQVTVVGNGSVYILATSTDDATQQDSCLVSVTLEPTGVSVSPAGPVSLVATGAGSSQQLSATVQPNPQANQAVIWSGGSASIATINSSGLVTAVSGAGGQTSVRATTVATPVQTADVTINVNPAQPGVITGAANIANGGTVTLSVPAVTGDTYTWTYPTANFTGSSTTNSITLTAKTVSTNAAGSISVVAKAPAHGGASPSRATTATVNVTPAQPGAITGAANIANGGTVTLTVPAVTGATSYTWTFPTANFTGSSTTNSITLTGKTVSTNAAATFSVTATGVGGTSPARAGTTAINVTSAQPGAITGAANIANGGTVTLTVPAVAGATSYTWTFPTANFTGSSTTNSITLTGKTVSTNAAATFSVTATGVGGTSPARAGTTAVNVVPAQPGTITPSPTTVTSGANVTLTVPAVTGATGYSWTFPTDYFTQTSPQTTTSPTVTLTTKSSGTAEANTFNVVATSAAGNSDSRTGSNDVRILRSCDGQQVGYVCWQSMLVGAGTWDWGRQECALKGWRLPTRAEAQARTTGWSNCGHYFWTNESCGGNSYYAYVIHASGCIYNVSECRENHVTSASYSFCLYDL
jgi:hypothetical protein